MDAVLAPTIAPSSSALSPSAGDAEARRIAAEVTRCSLSRPYFIDTYCRIFDAKTGDWIPFKLWAFQAEMIGLIEHNQFTVILKTRQIGATWIELANHLYDCLFRPIASTLMYSLRDEEAKALIERLKEMHSRLPKWLQTRRFLVDNAHQLTFANGSTVRAMPSTAGDSYTCTRVLIDEADLIPKLGKLVTRVKPTIDASGRMVLVSRVDKSKPNSYFKSTYKAAKAGENEWTPYFAAWHVRPDRTQAWYDALCRDYLANTGTLDDVWEQYPATDAEALAPRSLDKRLPRHFLNQCYEERKPLDLRTVPDAPALPGLRMYEPPLEGEKYVIGADTAEGNPNSNDSVGVVKHKWTGRSVCVIDGKFEPTTFGGYLHTLARYYKTAPILPERNNHGHTVIASIRNHAKETSSGVMVLNGYDEKAGYLSNAPGKTKLYDEYAEALRDEAVTVYDFKTYTQLASIEGATLLAPEGEMDDHADAEALAHQARGASSQVPQVRVGKARYKGNSW